MTTAFSVNWDYRCPFARNANEHVLAALDGGADYEVSFVAFSLDQAHVDEGQPAVWDLPDKRPNLMAGAAGIVVRDRFPEHFRSAHRALFAARHEDGADLRDPQVIRTALESGGVDVEAVIKELDDGWPYKALRDEHERSVSEHAAFGVPTFIIDDQAVFVRLMTRPGSDAALAVATIDQVLELLARHPELNEFKHTSIPR